MCSRGIIIILLSLVSLISGDDGPTSISISPSNRNKLGTKAIITCKVTAQYVGGTVQWWRRTGEIEDKLGYNTILEKAFGDTKRYLLSQWGERNGSTHRLEITDLRYEDAAQISCSLRSVSKSKEYVSLAVCRDDLETEACKCMVQKGWADPDCFKHHDSIQAVEDRYQRTVIGLGICFAIVVIYALVMTVLVGWDCMARLAAKEKRRQEIAKARAQRPRDIYDESEALQIDPNDTSSQTDIGAIDFKKPQSETPYKRGAGLHHVNHAYAGDDDGYQEIGATASAPPLGYHPNGVGAHGPTVAIVQPEPRDMEPLRTVSGRDSYPKGQDYVDDYHDVRSPGVPRTPADSIYPSTHYPDNRSPGSWSTKSAGAVQPPPAGFHFPDPQYNQGSPQDMRPNPRNAYSERPVRENPNHRHKYAEPRRLDFIKGQAEYGAPARGHYDDDEDDDGGFAVNPGSGSYIDKTDTVV